MAKNEKTETAAAVAPAVDAALAMASAKADRDELEALEKEARELQKKLSEVRASPLVLVRAQVSAMKEALRKITAAQPQSGRFRVTVRTYRAGVVYEPGSIITIENEVPGRTWEKLPDVEARLGEVQAAPASAPARASDQPI